MIIVGREAEPEGTELPMKLLSDSEVPSEAGGQATVTHEPEETPKVGAVDQVVITNQDISNQDVSQSPSASRTPAPTRYQHPAATIPANAPQKGQPCSLYMFVHSRL